MALIGGLLIIALILCIMHGNNQNAAPMLVVGAFGLVLLVGAAVDALIR